MKLLVLNILLTLSLPIFGKTSKSIVCRDAEFGAGHLKMIISDSSGFFAPRDQKPAVKAYFWIKGEMYNGILDAAMFMPDWNENSGWYRSSPPPLAYSLCDWKKCPIRKIRFMVHTKDQSKAEGNIKFTLQTSEKERVRFDRKLNCELK